MKALKGKTFVKPTARGVRVWIEGSKPAKAGFNWGATYTRTIVNGVITMTLDTEGTLTVAGRNRNGKELPIIDISAAALEGFTVNQQVEVTYTEGRIVIK